MQFHALERTAIEREFEKRFEKMCEKNGWIASANLLYGTETVRMVLEKRTITARIDAAKWVEKAA